MGLTSPFFRKVGQEMCLHSQGRKPSLTGTVLRRATEYFQRQDLGSRTQPQTFYEGRHLGVEICVRFSVRELPVAIGVQTCFQLEGWDLGEVKDVGDARGLLSELEAAVVVDRKIAQRMRPCFSRDQRSEHSEREPRQQPSPPDHRSSPPALRAFKLSAASSA